MSTATQEDPERLTQVLENLKPEKQGLGHMTGYRPGPHKQQQLWCNESQAGLNIKDCLLE